MKPYFSIIIPTCNRVDDLVFATRKLLNQTFKNFEIIIIDNSNSNNTEKKIKKITDKRIKYTKNKKNIGWILNLKKGISLAKGKYIILHGDDDYVINDNILEELYAVILETRAGFIRLNYISKIEHSNEFIDFKENKKYRRDVFLSKKKSIEEIFEFIRNTDPFFITGLVFKNIHKKTVDIVESELSPWIKFLFNNSYFDGAYYVSKYSFIAKWKNKDITPGHPFFYLNNNRFSFETFFKIIKEIDSKNYKTLIKKDFDQMIKLFPANKLSTSNKNMIDCAKRILYLDSSYYKSIYFWFFFIISLLSPKFVLGTAKKIFIRYIIISSKIENKKILNRIF